MKSSVIFPPESMQEKLHQISKPDFLDQTENIKYTEFRRGSTYVPMQLVAADIIKDVLFDDTTVSLAVEVSDARIVVVSRAV